MDVISRLRGWALARPRVLLVDAPGSTALRWAVEASLDRRGWELAPAPAATDLLVVLGAPSPDLAAAVDVLWSQVPEPRLRRGIASAAEVDAVLDAAVAALRAPSAATEARPSPEQLLGVDEQGVDEQGADDEGADDDGGMDHGGMDHGDMDHGSMEIAGLPMADTGEDRDGLELDVLPIGLGPVLPGWPTGLVLRAEAHGDVLVAPDLAWLDGESLPAAEPGLDPRVLALDRVAGFLDVAGWVRAARAARRARDGLWSDDPGHAADGAATEVAHRVRRSRLLAWTAGSDVMAGVRAWCDVAAGDGGLPAGVSLDRLAADLDGVEIGRARLVVAAAWPSPVGAAVGAGSARA